MPHETCLVKIDKARPYIDAFVQYCLQFGIGQGSGEEGTMEVLYAHIYFTAHIMCAIETTVWCHLSGSRI